MTNASKTETVPLRDYVDVRFTDIEKARVTAEAQLNMRLESMNEFRSSLKDQASTFLTRTEYEAKHDALESKIHVLQLDKATLEGKANQSALTFTTLISIGGILLSIIALLKEFMK
jgi:hypothetical protein